MNDFESLICRRQYNDLRKLLFEKTESIRKYKAERINKQAKVFEVDSMSLVICKISREPRSKMGKESEHHSRTKALVHQRKNIFMAINYIVFFQQPG